MKRTHFFPRILVVLAVMLAMLWIIQPAQAALGWVGNMFPAGGSTNNITVGGNFTVYVQVWKSGVTEAPGQGANITCTLQWATVPYLGGGWTNTTDTPMVFNAQVDNNDEYRAEITPGVGIYEFNAFCTDTTDNSTMWQGGGIGRLFVRTAAGGCNSAAPSDNNVYWNGLLHDSFSTSYRDPIGPVATSQGAVTLRFRTCMNDLDAAPAIRIWDDRNNAETIAALSFDSHADGGSEGSVTLWRYDLAVPSSANILYYVFRAVNGSATAYYRDDNPQFYGGGYGQAEGSQTTAYGNSYQLTVYDPLFSVPAWMQRAIVYQIFPDRFRDGTTGNNPAAGRFSYGSNVSIARSSQANWNYTVCDPRSTYSPSCANRYGDNFYGGDLAGITEKVNAGYFDSLGITVLYLNPIFRSPSNHKYDTADYMTIDPDFGTLADFQALVAAADSHGMRIILDGVFNHTSSDSTYFDLYSRYDSAGNLTSPSGAGTDDNSGACESGASGYYPWFYFAVPPADFGAENGGTCNNGASDAAQNYRAWYGYGSLPKLQANSTAVRNLIWANGLSSVGPYWVSQGADGWRFDVGGDVDPGLTNDPANTYWEGFRAAVRSINPSTLTLGEEWGDASAWLLGSEWDSVMNYRFRSAVMSWLFTGCSGNGCTGGTQFVDNDSNTGSSSGAISYLSPSQFNARLRSIQEDYPPMAWKAMMNLEGSHDTNRLRFLLKKINNDNDGAAVQRMKEWWLFAFTYAGAPTLYYGDEIGLNHDGVWANSKWEDDPYNRAPFPWDDAAGSSYSADTTDLLVHARRMASIRQSYPALQDGDVQHGLIIDDANQLYGFARTNGSQTALIALNRSGAAHTATFTGLNAAPYNLPNGAILVDALNGGAVTVSGGQVSVTVNPAWGVILLEQAKVDSPAAASLSLAPSGQDVVLTWGQVTRDAGSSPEVITSYQIWRGPNPSLTGATLRDTITPPAFGSSGAQLTYTDASALGGTSDLYYCIVALNAAGQSATSNCPGISPTTVELTGLKANTPSTATLAVAGILLALLAGIVAFWQIRAKGSKGSNG